MNGTAMKVYIEDMKNGKWRVRWQNFCLYCDSVAEADQLGADLYQAMRRQDTLDKSNLVQLVLSLCRELPPGNEWIKKAKDALIRWGVEPSPLKENE